MGFFVFKIVFSCRKKGGVGFGAVAVEGDVEIRPYMLLIKRLRGYVLHYRLHKLAPLPPGALAGRLIGKHQDPANKQATMPASLITCCCNRTSTLSCSNIVLLLLPLIIPKGQLIKGIKYWQVFILILANFVAIILETIRIPYSV